jgi:hypothetical protein
MTEQLRVLTDAELAEVSGGYDEGNWCGTPVPHQPLPHIADAVQKFVLPALSVNVLAH